MGEFQATMPGCSSPTDVRTPFPEKRGGLGPACTASAQPTAPPTLGFALLLAMGREETETLKSRASRAGLAVT